ncbi:MAG TPA: aspartate aminotransferase family protein [Spongiibacteraceae bacterium]|nr:aspartate aminotransferase family protein [Spongiibacteraceae bacterium]MBN51738.1 aspartate aminotransferase family protein [Spongiibacteraceae bacterium]HCS25843.1 aspartate aminotransferase family protein [Spongiibacteraceae bacterium]|tara:strand:+ start:776 stop:1966 length:1191 start_codon:yes stop_codon:yes gene_type:complete
MSTGTVMSTYNRLPVSFSHGEGVWLFDDNGKRYLDAISGIGVNALGHAHPELTRRLQAQAGELLHTSNVYGVKNQQALADALCAASGMDNVFFCNSGAEGNEAAIKLARLYGHSRDIDRPTIVVMENAFHGRTMATLTASGNRKVQAGFEPLINGFTRAPYGDIKALENIAKNNHDVCAVLLEPIQGEGGVNLLPEGFMESLRALCDQHHWLLMLDEVQTGNGRTGKYFAYQHSSVLPDVVVTAKGLGGGVPIGACLAKGTAASLFKPGNHGSTFGGNPLACAAGLAVVESLHTEKLIDNAEAMGQRLLDGLRERLANNKGVIKVRGKGLMIGIQMAGSCGELVAQALEAGLLINVTADKVVRLLPPLTINEQEIQGLIDTLCPLIDAWQQQPSAA